jgi:hypothetical protein
MVQAQTKQTASNTRITAMNRTIITSVAILAAMTTGVFADTIDRRQANQAERIRQERRDGDLTLRETMALRAEQARIAEMERRAKSDGVVTRREARTLDRAQDAAGRHIAQESNDRQKSWFRKWF